MRKAGDKSLHIEIGGNDMYIDIDRAIEALKGCTNKTDRQIAKWLEKLKYVENIILKWNADWYNDEDTGIPDNEILETIFNACTDNGFDIPIDEDYRRIYNNALNDIESEFLKCEKVHYNLQDILNVLNKVKVGANNGTDNQ